MRKATYGLAAMAAAASLDASNLAWSQAKPTAIQQQVRRVQAASAARAATQPAPSLALPRATPSPDYGARAMKMVQQNIARQAASSSASNQSIAESSQEDAPSQPVTPESLALGRRIAMVLDAHASSQVLDDSATFLSRYKQAADKERPEAFDPKIRDPKIREAVERADSELRAQAMDSAATVYASVLTPAELKTFADFVERPEFLAIQAKQAVVGRALFKQLSEINLLATLQVGQGLCRAEPKRGYCNAAKTLEAVQKQRHLLEATVSAPQN